MTRYGFLIDQDTCIGCHACSVACKSEHDVPLGVNRTWLKYIEKGTFPEVRRQYAVLRCNHCDAAPCVTICPTKALFHRPDGIVDFDISWCIGCKSCMNACPYDALYLDPATMTAQKCNYCAHRVEVGLEPACVIVCPTQSIVAGDLDDPGSRISAVAARHDVHVRAPEQGTRPKLFYKGADEASLDPLRTRIAPDGLIWADTTPYHPTIPVDEPPDARQPTSDGHVVARTAYTTAHPPVWKAKVSAYLVTKAMAAGVLAVAALLVLLGHADVRAGVGVVPPVLAGAFLALTGVLLVADLKQPRRFHYLLTHPNWSSWLVRGAVVLMLYAVVAAVWFLGGVVDAPGLVQAMAVPAVVLGAATAGYTALLFAQCEGRDLWQTPLLLLTLLAQAVVAGAAVWLIVDAVVDVPSVGALQWTLLGGIAALAVLVAVELSSGGTRHVHLAVAALTRGPYAGPFWVGGVIVGMVVPATLLIAGLVAHTTSPSVGVVAGLTALVGLAAYEDAFVRAGQSVPLS